MTIPAFNKQINIKGFGIDRYKDGKIIERMQLGDDVTLQQQIGAMPDTGSAK
ncbi:hypothetical protein IC229_17040 [Spirosoma sp. BT702]|uniref:Uncharacterized protein n=1 Tax=Spirosoma profusum TaxID=2771354 RepID=A0A927ARH9_9BACT|nr:hypothetical protein [Spirosoma profusum]MBD2702358.1 hypothetical protein [Spirosoma profusum]